MESRCENCIIRQFNSLRAMSKEELKKVSDTKTTKKIKKGEPLFEEGDKLNGSIAFAKEFLNFQN